jgi:hypothetical protein
MAKLAVLAHAATQHLGVPIQEWINTYRDPGHTEKEAAVAVTTEKEAAVAVTAALFERYAAPWNRWFCVLW